MCLGRSSSWKSASHCRRLPRVVFRKFVLDRNRTLDLGHPRIAGLSSAMRLVYPLTNWGKEPPFLFVVAKLYFCNFGDTVCRSGDSAVRAICFGPEVCGSTPSPCKVLFCLPRPPRSLAPLSRPPSRDRSLPRLLSFPRADREKEGSSLLTRKVRKVGSAPARRLRSLRSPPPRDDISGKT